MLNEYLSSCLIIVTLMASLHNIFPIMLCRRIIPIINRYMSLCSSLSCSKWRLLSSYAEVKPRRHRHDTINFINCWSNIFIDPMLNTFGKCYVTFLQLKTWTISGFDLIPKTSNSRIFPSSTGCTRDNTLPRK